MKKIVSLVLAMAMAVSSVQLTFARYDDSAFDYHKTSDLELIYAPSSNSYGISTQLVLTWPAVDKQGNLLNQNPLSSTSSYGNPTAGWTTVNSGMVIAFDRWDIATGSVKPTQKSDGEQKLLYGLSKDKVTEYPVILADNSVAYLSDEEVAANFATCYEISYAKAGEEFVVDHIVSQFNHGKKLNRPVVLEDGSWELNEDGTYKTKADSQTTFFLEDQLTETLNARLEDNTEYTIRVSAYTQKSAGNSVVVDTSYNNGQPYKVFEKTIKTPEVNEPYRVKAFPTVEGGGTYSYGGRGSVEFPGDVYIVTNLTDSVSDPQPGSLRYGLSRLDREDKDSTYPRTIIFGVGGTIHIDPTVGKGARRFNIPSNTTIAGQTAPGDGITIAGGSAKFDGENIIVRYMHFRLGDGYDQDAATASGKNIVIDHCSFAMGVDECFTAKELLNSSIQYNIIAQALNMPYKDGANSTDAELSGVEGESKHGMGAIWNGYETSFTHNLIASNGNRNPRFEGAFEYNSQTYTNKLDYSNNVVYNWGYNSGYGGDRGEAQVNFVNNYYKPGPSTIEKVKSQFFDCDTSSEYNNVRSSYYISGNIMEGNDSVTNDNTLGFTDLGTYGYALAEAVELECGYEAESAEAAYEAVLNSAGASYARDAQDARIINDVIYNTGYLINSEKELGGWDEAVYTHPDLDNNGTADVFEGIVTDVASEEYCGNIILDEASPFWGHSRLEKYLDEMFLNEYATGAIKANVDNPVPVITSISAEDGALDLNSNMSLIAGKEYKIEFSVTNKAGEKVNYEAVEGYLNDEVVFSGKDSISYTPEKLGQYSLLIKVKNSDNNLSSFSRIYPIAVVPEFSNIDGFTAQDIGDVGQAGVTSYDSAEGALYMQGTGRIGYTATTSGTANDSFYYNYIKTSGDIELSAKIDDWSRIDTFQKAGVMIRSSLDENSEFYLSTLTYLKSEDYGTKDVNGNAMVRKNIASFYRLAGSNSVAPPNKDYRIKFLAVPQKRENEEQLDSWVKIQKVGQTVTTYASNDGETWYKLQELETTLGEEFYIGFAVEAAQDTCEAVRYNRVKFSNIELNEVNNGLLGDSDENGTIEARDAANALQYVLNSECGILSEQGIKNVSVSGSADLSATDAALILQKVLNSEFVFPVES